MTLELRKFHLIEMIMAIRDESLLAKYEDNLRKARIEAYEASLKPMTPEEYRKRILDAEEEINAGKFITIEDLQKEMGN